MSNEINETTTETPTGKTGESWVAGFALLFVTLMATGYAVKSSMDIIGKLVCLLVELYLAAGATYLITIDKTWADTKCYKNDIAACIVALLIWPISAIKAINLGGTKESIANIKRSGIKGALDGLRSAWTSTRNITSDAGKMLLTLLVICTITVVLAVVNVLQIAALLISSAIAIYLIGMSICFWSSDLRKTGATRADLIKLAVWPLAYLGIIRRGAQIVRAARRNAA